METPAFHPNSRKARQEIRKEKTKQKKKDRKATKIKEQQPRVKKMLWFKQQLETGKEHYNHREICEIIESRYLNRNDDELRELHAINSKYEQRPKASKEDQLMLVRRHEWETYITGGFLAPDFTKKRVVDKLNEWEGDINTIEHIQQVKFKPVDEIASVPSPFIEKTPKTAKEENLVSPINFG